MVGIPWCDICEAAWARLGRCLTPLLGLTIVSSGLSQAQPLRTGDARSLVRVSLPYQRQLGALGKAGDPSAQVQKIQRSGLQCLLAQDGGRRPQETMERVGSQPRGWRARVQTTK